MCKITRVTSADSSGVQCVVGVLDGGGLDSCGRLAMFASYQTSVLPSTAHHQIPPLPTLPPPSRIHVSIYMRKRIGSPPIAIIDRKISIVTDV